MDYGVAVPVIASFVISAAAGPVVIPVLRKMKVGQTVRDDGPQTHLKKNGTPTMGGLIFLFSVVVVSLFYVKDYPKVIPILFVTVGFGIVGFLDDYIKVVLRRSEGLTPGQKMAGQILVTAVFAWYMASYSDVGFEILIPFSGGVYLNPGFFSVPLLFAAVIGTVNGTNFTDGLDGLASSVEVSGVVFFTVVAIGTGSGDRSGHLCRDGRTFLVFLLFNVYPASVFMGDTGSLALGGFVASTAYMLKLPLFIPIVGLIYVVEVLSVIITGNLL